ncbi:hypothetical protein EVAR_43571_1 [Eumeta japonica]|uniref:Uncharacterized protein n=1 Tax=Eumeta variegata TaxID=151549 RepID=A0A4C1XGR0_EUMVA|nr:hypothetical protein EVAR_43571_1 [Eumeta japonica]
MGSVFTPEIWNPKKRRASTKESNDQRIWRPKTGPRSESGVRQMDTENRIWIRIEHRPAIEITTESVINRYT